jgi:crotonobetainyl-CoA:carnitine CoA-transferase CaiB-like acyl-CoA transferase
MTASTAPIARRGPLAGTRVLDLSRVLAGPLCSMVLADLGAEVIKVEDTANGDQTRTIPPFVNGESHYFLAINRNKKSVSLDARTTEGRDALLRIVAHCDVVLENFRPGVMERLGLGEDKLRAIKPDLVICSISGFGQDGPMRDKPSFDLVTQALSGVMSINGYADGLPTKLGLPLGDIGGGLWAAIGVLAALAERRTTGRGSRVDLSLLEGLMGLLGYLAGSYFVTGENPGRMGNSHHSIVPYGLMPAKDGHIVLALHVGEFWRKFCRAIGREDLLANPNYRTVKDRHHNRAELESLLANILQTRTVAEWHAILDDADVPNAPVNNIGQALMQPVIAARGFVHEIEHPVAGMIRVLGSPLRFPGNYQNDPPAPPPLLGEHTRGVLATLAGLDAASIERMFASGAAREPAKHDNLSKEPQP